jgi:predicted nucleic acid-binding protein
VFLVDANVVIDAVAEAGEWRDWSLKALETAGQAGDLHIKPIIYAEASTRFAVSAEIDACLAKLKLVPRNLPYEAAFLGAKAFQPYRRLGGSKSTALPDFFIGAHAKVEGWTLITHDAGRFRTYFPGVPLIAPD